MPIFRPELLTIFPTTCVELSSKTYREGARRKPSIASTMGTASTPLYEVSRGSIEALLVGQ